MELSMMSKQILHAGLDMKQTMHLASKAEQRARSRFIVGSPCKFIRALDVLVHLVLPELIENIFPATARYLRRTSPRWGQSWRGWENTNE